MSKRKFIITLLLFLLPYITGFGEVNRNTIDVSLINLIATPDKYDGKVIRVIGVSNIEFEGTAIFLSKEDFLNMVTKNALWMSFNEKAIDQSGKELSKYNGKYVLVEGVFRKNHHGHMGLFSGTIENITRFDPMPSRKDIEEMLNKCGKEKNTIDK